MKGCKFMCYTYFWFATTEKATMFGNKTTQILFPEFT